MSKTKIFKKEFDIKPTEVTTNDVNDILQYIGEKIRDTSAELMLEAKAFVEEESKIGGKTLKVTDSSIKKPVPGKEHFQYVVELNIVYGEG